MALALCSLSASDTRRALGSLWAIDAMYADLRSFQGGLGNSSVSEFASTIRAWFAELLRDACPRLRASAVLDHVMEERSDRLVLRAAHLEDDRRHGQEMRRIWDLRALAQLLAMVIEREDDGPIEPV